MYELVTDELHVLPKSLLAKLSIEVIDDSICVLSVLAVG
jgi:hypothetical protein